MQNWMKIFPFWVAVVVSEVKLILNVSGQFFGQESDYVYDQ